MNLKRIDNHTFDGVPFFEGCDRRSLAEIAPHADRIRVPSGTVLATAGHRARELIVVVEGCVRTEDASGAAMLFAGQAIAPGAAAEGAPSPVSATALGEVELLVVNGPAFRWAVREIPLLAERAARMAHAGLAA